VDTDEAQERYDDWVEAQWADHEEWLDWEPKPLWEKGIDKLVQVVVDCLVYLGGRIRR
jgi:hypothetical protein